MTKNISSYQEQILRRKQVESVTGLSRSTIYAMVKRGEFPAPIQLGSGHAVGWLQPEVQKWIEDRVRERDSQLAARRRLEILN